MNTKTLKNWIAIILIFTMTGCEKIQELSQPSPGEIAITYMNALLDDNLVLAYSLVSSEDQTIKSAAEFGEEMSKNKSPIKSIFRPRFGFDVANVVITDDSAKVFLKIKSPDLSILFEEYMAAILKMDSTSSKDDDEVMTRIANKYNNNDLPIKETTEDFSLVRETGGWKMSLSWRSEKEAKEKSKKVKSLIGEATDLRKAKQLTSAVQKYEEIIALGGEMVEAQKLLEETKNEIALLQAKKDYISKVKLYDFKSKYYEQYSSKKVPGVDFKLKNNGDKSLTRVEVTVFFKDANGNIVSEEDYNPIIVTKRSFSNDNKPLKPGYIWQMERGTFYTAKNVPSEWKEGSATATITDIEFEE